MIHPTLPLNPFLAEKIGEYRSGKTDEMLREDYETAAEEAGRELSWAKHLALRALEAVRRGNTFLLTKPAASGLSESAKKGLYWAGVDSVSDLLQLTEDELLAVSEEKGFDAQEVKDYLAMGGFELVHFDGPTSKLYEDGSLWAIPAAGAAFPFNPSRLTLDPAWFDEYYRRSGHFDGEEQAEYAFQNVPMPRLDADGMPYDYREFFQAAKNLWDAYEDCCLLVGIPPRVPRPSLPDKDVRSIYKDGARVIVDIFERTTLLGRIPAGEFLSAPRDESRLYIAEGIKGPECFQMLLITFVELKVDIESIAFYLKDCLKGRHQWDFERTVKPVDPQLVEVIRQLRDKCSDEDLRAQYRKELERNPSLSWEEFITQAALAEP